MDRKKRRLIIQALITIITKIKCKLTCCCQSTCNQPREDRTVLKWVDDKGVPHKQVII
jgi:hypothetical protein|tara:strand:- start:7160 stop:7333 length:174 start_codon:yes stop_codon:yes gene_type:complete